MKTCGMRAPIQLDLHHDARRLAARTKTINLGLLVAGETLAPVFVG